MYAAAILAMSCVFMHRARKAFLSADRAATAAAWAIVLGMVGARAYHLVASAKLGDPFQSWWSSPGGTASWGAYIGAAAGIAGYLRWAREPALPYFDAATSCAGLGIFLGRLSCLLAGDDFGRVTTLPWGIRYPPESYAYNAQISSGVLHAPAALSLPTHPVQLYLGVTALAVFIVASKVWNRWHKMPGFTLSAVLVLDASTRFWWEFLRDPAAGGGRTFLSSSQWMCLFFLTAGVWIAWSCNLGKRGRALAAARSPSEQQRQRAGGRIR
jgi:prolipoprotein diacylglyceryltransferase